MATEVNALELTRDLLSFNTVNPPGHGATIRTVPG